MRSTSSQLEKMIPPWIKNPSPASNNSLSKQQGEGSSATNMTMESPMSSYYFEMDNPTSSSTQSQSKPVVEKVAETVATVPSPSPATPTPSLQRSESSRSANHLLDAEAEPVWLRDLKVSFFFFFNFIQLSCQV